VRRVVESLPPRATVAVYPDHPFLLEPPEILVGQNGELAGIFVLTARDRPGTGRNSFARYLLARLALPEHATLVIAAEDIDLIGYTKFAAVDDIRPADQTPFRWPSDRRPSRWNEAVENIRWPHFERFADTWKSGADAQHARLTRQRKGRSTTTMWLQGLPAARDASTRTPRDVRIAIPDDDRGRQPGRERAQSWRPVVAPDGERLALERTPTDRPSDLRIGLALACRSAVSVDYGLGLGLDGLSETASALESAAAYLPTHLISVGDRPSGRRFDVDRPLRSAAFVGFDLSTVSVD
jgi:hypothetical protein